ncbi:hypothetical protein MMC11_008009 [Xylographa trunciseda]|nr:hypothetical protein [Xylographa trunciseda]
MPRGAAKKETGPPINATSKDEEAFIQYDPSAVDVNGSNIDAEFLKNANSEEEKAKH